jgi:hypothetical protein
MATGLPGADSSSPVTTQVQGQTLIQYATAQFGQAPVFWGRYFTSPTTGGTVEYRHATEDGPLNAAGIPVLPVARQTANVDGSADDGAADATANVADILASFGADYLAGLNDTFYVFLDVEGDPSLSASYWTGWSQTLVNSSSNQTGGAVTLSPCIYATQGDNATWTALAQAMNAGAACEGAWIARYPAGGCDQILEWDDTVVTPTAGVPCPILAWQYAGNCGPIDCSQTNPELDPQVALLQFLILPPAD